MTTVIPFGQAQGGTDETWLASVVGPNHEGVEQQPVKDSGTYVTITEKLSPAPILFCATQETIKATTSGCNFSCPSWYFLLVEGFFCSSLRLQWPWAGGRAGGMSGLSFPAFCSLNEAGMLFNTKGV